MTSLDSPEGQVPRGRGSSVRKAERVTLGPYVEDRQRGLICHVHVATSAGTDVMDALRSRCSPKVSDVLDRGVSYVDFAVPVEAFALTPKSNWEAVLRDLFGVSD